MKSSCMFTLNYGIFVITYSYLRVLGKKMQDDFRKCSIKYFLKVWLLGDQDGVVLSHCMLDIFFKSLRSMLSVFGGSDQVIILNNLQFTKYY